VSNPYQDFLDPKKRGNYVTCSIDGVQFHINPTSYTERSEAIHVDLPTRAGIIRMSFGARQTVYSLEGFTGVAGVKGLTAMERFRPKAGNNERIVTFKFPSRFTDTKFVYVNVFEDSITSDMHLYNQYRIELAEYGQQLPTAVTKLANSASQALSIPILPGGGGQIVTTPPAVPGGGGGVARIS